MEKKKSLGQVFTPRHIVDTILDRIGYSGSDILHRRLLEPSCGDGAFLVPVVERIIQEARRQGLEDLQIVSLLEENIQGIEYDEEAIIAARENLDLVARQHLLPAVKWNLVHADTLSFSPSEPYHYIVGNPPYIRIHNMDAHLRNQVKKFASATGTTDLYIIFYELGLSWLAEEGVLGYIAPNSWFKNASQKNTRQRLIRERQIREIINFGARPIFGTDAATYTSIVVLNKNGGNEYISYTEDSQESWTRNVPYSDFLDYAGEPFTFVNTEDHVFLKTISQCDNSLGKNCTIQNGVATLRDKIFLGAPVEAEEGIILPAVKGSTYKGAKPHERIVFPYRQEDEKLRPMLESELASYPLAHEYLLSHQEELLKRDTDKSALWFHYGRSQGLVNMLKPKLVFSHIVHPDQTVIRCFELPENIVVYSGLFITSTEDGLSLSDVKDIIESPEFCRYIKLVGKDMNGGYKSFGSKQVRSFGILA